MLMLLFALSITIVVPNQSKSYSRQSLEVTYKTDIKEFLRGEETSPNLYFEVVDFKNTLKPSKFDYIF